MKRQIMPLFESVRDIFIEKQHRVVADGFGEPRHFLFLPGDIRRIPAKAVQAYVTKTVQHIIFAFHCTKVFFDTKRKEIRKKHFLAFTGRLRVIRQGNKAPQQRFGDHALVVRQLLRAEQLVCLLSGFRDLWSLFGSTRSTFSSFRVYAFNEFMCFQLR